jgi:hypothetical protein
MINHKVFKTSMGTQGEQLVALLEPHVEKLKVASRVSTGNFIADYWLEFHSGLWLQVQVFTTKLAGVTTFWSKVSLSLEGRMPLTSMNYKLGEEVDLNRVLRIVLNYDDLCTQFKKDCQNLKLSENT